MLRLLVVYLIIALASANLLLGSLKTASKRLRPQQERKHLKLLDLHPHYHSTEGIHNELAALAARCPALSVEQKEGVGSNGESSLIDVVTVRAPGAKKLSKNFFLYGEHARELVSAESGLHFAKTLCGETPALQKQAAKVLQSSEFQFIVNGNPASRKKVEEGEFCLRMNPNGVDLNRNWDEAWKKDDTLSDTNPGKESFSEAETRLFRDLVTEYKPEHFLSIHSGTRGMYMPWAYNSEAPAKRNQAKMMNLLRVVDEKYCKCPFGAAGKEVGYDCPGTSLDYVFDKLQTPYAFAVEIFTDEARSTGLEERWAEAMKSKTGALLQVNSHLGHPHFRDVFANHPSSFVQLRSNANHTVQDDPADCFSMFNPQGKEEYDKVMENWSGAYLNMAQIVADNDKDKSTGPDKSPGEDEKQSL